MSSISITRHVAAPVADVWATLADFGGIYRFSAGVETSPINEGKPTQGVGAERNCQLYDGHHMQERVIQSVDQQKLVIEVFETSMPMKSAEATFLLTATPSGTNVTMTMDYVIKYGPLGMAMDALMVKSSMTAKLNGLLAGLEHHVTTGELIGKGWTLAESGGPGQQAVAS